MNPNLEVFRDLTLDYPSWHVDVGEALTEFAREKEPELADTFDVWFECGDLMNWIALEFPRRRYAGNGRIMPTEMLNADACRAFGQLSKAGFAGSAYAVAASDDATIRDVVLASSCGRDALLISLRRMGHSSWRMSAINAAEDPK